MCLFSDIPSHTYMTEADVDVGDTQLGKQCPYWLLIVKCKRIEKEVEYMLEHGKVTKPDCSPTPRMEHCIDQVECYWQLPLTARAKEMTGFIMPQGFYYPVLPLGLVNTVATFQ